MKNKNLIMFGIFVLFLIGYVVAEELVIRANLKTDSINYLQGQADAIGTTTDNLISQMIEARITSEKNANYSQYMGEKILEFDRLANRIKEKPDKLNTAITQLKIILAKD